MNFAEVWDIQDLNITAKDLSDSIIYYLKEFYGIYDLLLRESLSALISKHIHDSNPVSSLWNLGAHVTDTQLTAQCKCDT